MVAFKKMWEDVNVILADNTLQTINIVETFKSGFIVKDKEETHFVTKDDFVDFWCKLLCLNSIEKEEITQGEESKQKYVYEIVKNLPYITEKNGMINLNE